MSNGSAQHKVTTSARIICSCVLAAGAPACASHRADWPPSYIKFLPQADARILIQLGPARGLPSLLAAGDSLQLEVRRERCQADLCAGDMRPLRGVRWAASGRGARIGVDGMLHVTRRGTVRVTARFGDTVLARALPVLPPVAALSWVPHIAAMAIGDTVHLRIAALDSAGRMVAYLPAAAVSWVYNGRDSAGAHSVWSADSTLVVAAGVREGIVHLLVRLAHRTDSLLIAVAPRN